MGHPHPQAGLGRAVLVFLVSAGCHPAFSLPDPPDKTVRVFYIRPTDVAENPKMATGITSVMRDAQKYFLEQCKFTFQLNEPVVEVVKGSHPRNWYETNPGGGSDEYWRAVYNARDDLLNLVPSVKADGSRKRWKIVYYIDAEGPGAGGGGGGGWVLLPKHDADGALGYPSQKARWVGGMSHELGHCFGLPDAASTDGTVMSASFYSWPNCTITPAMTNTMKNLGANAGFWFPSISTASRPVISPLLRLESWSPRFSGNDLLVDLPMLAHVLPALSLYDAAGRLMLRYAPGAKDKGKQALSLPVGDVSSGDYVLSLEESGRVIRTGLVRKE